MKSFPALFCACSWYWRLKFICSNLLMRSSACSLNERAPSSSACTWCCLSCWMVTALFRILFSFSTFWFRVWRDPFSDLRRSISAACCWTACCNSWIFWWEGLLLWWCCCCVDDPKLCWGEVVRVRLLFAERMAEERKKRRQWGLK